jgi:hypothetical protein
VQLVTKSKMMSSVQIALNGFSSFYHHFVQVICGQEKLPDFKQLWDAFIGEELRLQQVSNNFEDEVPKLAFIEKMRKGGKKGPKQDQKSEEESYQGKCFKCE